MRQSIARTTVLAAAALIIVVAACAAALQAAARRNPASVEVGTWDCGYARPTARMQSRSRVTPRRDRWVG